MWWRQSWFSLNGTMGIQGRKGGALLRHSAPQHQPTDPCTTLAGASGGEAPGGGPILQDGVKPWPVSGDRHLGSSAETDDVLFVRLQKRVLLSRHAARKTTPAGTSPVVTMRHNAISSFLARATIRVLRVRPRASAVRARYHCASALSF